MKVAVIGAGIGGLALSLYDAGILDIDVYEAASKIREQGVGINLLPHDPRRRRGPSIHSAALLRRAAGPAIAHIRDAL
jgi:2-polyprenyl-6-methoxyphenol hydroxylase-like FAD-dependent oxidoreductase